MTKVVVLDSRHRPMELSVLVVALFAGLFGLIRDQPGSVLSQLSFGYPWIWNAGVMLAATVALSSVFLAIPDSLLLERVGLCMLFTFFGSYGVGGLVLSGGPAFPAAFYSITIAGGAVGRAVQITNDLKRLRRAIDGAEPG